MNYHFINVFKWMLSSKYGEILTVSMSHTTVVLIQKSTRVVQYNYV